MFLVVKFIYVKLKLFIVLNFDTFLSSNFKN